MKPNIYQIGDALRRAGISRATYFRWVRCGRLPDVGLRDRNGRRVFTDAELQDLIREAQQLVQAHPATDPEEDERQSLQPTPVTE